MLGWGFVKEFLKQNKEYKLVFENQFYCLKKGNLEQKFSMHDKQDLKELVDFSKKNTKCIVQ